MRKRKRRKKKQVSHDYNSFFTQQIFNWDAAVRREESPLFMQSITSFSPPRTSPSSHCGYLLSRFRRRRLPCIRRERSVLLACMRWRVMTEREYCVSSSSQLFFWRSVMTEKSSKIYLWIAHLLHVQWPTEIICFRVQFRSRRHCTNRSLMPLWESLSNTFTRMESSFATAESSRNDTMLPMRGMHIGMTRIHSIHRLAGKDGEDWSHHAGQASHKYPKWQTVAPWWQST